jgi:hypothetical protein
MRVVRRRRRHAPAPICYAGQILKEDASTAYNEREHPREGAASNVDLTHCMRLVEGGGAPERGLVAFGKLRDGEDVGAGGDGEAGQPAPVKGDGCS